MGAAVRGVEGAGGAGGEMSLRGQPFWQVAPSCFVLDIAQYAKIIWH